MKCYICDRTLEDDQVQFNEDHKDIDPCPSCLMAIEDILAGYGDRPDTVIEDEFSPFEGLFPLSYDPFGTEEP